jgi:hypothetical protein
MDRATGTQAVILALYRLAGKACSRYIHGVRAAIDIVEAVRAGRQRI